MFQHITKKQKKELFRILLCIPFFITGILLPSHLWITLMINIIAFLIVGSDVLWNALKNLLRKQMFDENLLMSIASLGAFFTGEYVESVAVMLFYQIGEWFQSYSVSRSRKSIQALMDIRPDYANMKKDGVLVQVDPEEVAPNDIIFIKAGERIPLDGFVLQGSSMLDTSALTGESIPRTVHEGDEVLSGSINQTGLLQVQVTKGFGESTVSKILDLVENASSKKSKSEQFITKFARYYTPAVVISALFLAFLPPLLIPDALFADWIHRALIFLVISCPCALVISVPLSFFGGIGGASKVGVLIKGSNYMETLSKAEIVVFDKTGTLTKGNFEVQEICPANENTPLNQSILLEMAAYTESYSTHPIAVSLRNAYGKAMDDSRISNIEEIHGHGVTAIFDQKTIYAGNDKLMAQMGVSIPNTPAHGTVVHVATNNEYAGYILIADTIKKDATAAITALKTHGIKKAVMLTGDRKEAANAVSSQLGLDEVYAELLPQNKVEQVERLLSQTSAKGTLIFIGDGINDAPVLSRADIGIAMGGVGSDAAIEAADIVIMTDEPSKIADALAISKKTLRIVKQNIIFALTIKFLFLIMGAFGAATMWEAVFADVGVSVIAILNAMRALKTDR